MTGACEILMVISLMGEGGSSSLISRCVPTYEICVQQIAELSDGFTGARISQCVGVGGLVDAGRGK